MLDYIKDIKLIFFIYIVLICLIVKLRFRVAISTNRDNSP